MSKKTIVGVGVLALVLGAYWTYRSWTDPQPVEPVEIARPNEAAADLSDTEAAADLRAKDLADQEPAQRGVAPAPVAEDRDPVAPTSGSVRIEVKRASGQPAADVEVYVKRGAEGDIWRGDARRKTNAQGRVEVTGLAPGTVTVGTLQNYNENSKEVEILVGQMASSSFELPDGITVRGTVRDEEDRPVPGAAIWVATGLSYWLGGSIAGHADDNGRYEVFHVERGTGVGAFAAGHGRSQVIDLDHEVPLNGVLDLDLVLRGVGGTVTGVVLNPEGVAVEGAWVALGKPVRNFRWSGNDGSIVEKWTPMTQRTGPDGTFRFDGMPFDTHPLEVKAKDFALWTGEVEVTHQKGRPVTVFLNEGYTLTGTVTDAEGEAIQDAVVRAYHAEPGTDFVQGGQVDFYGSFGYGKTSADADGLYRIEHLPAVPTHVWAMPKQNPYRDFGTAVPRYNAVVEGRVGTEVLHDIEIGEGLVLHGRVTYSDGEPMPMVFVTARERETSKRHTIVTSEEGTFRYTNMEEGSYSIGVQLRNPPEGSNALEAQGVSPGPDEILLEADFPSPNDLEPGQLTGRVVDAGDRLEDLSLLRVVLRYRTSYMWREDPEMDGMSFAFSDITPGEYRVNAFNGDTLIYQSEWFEVEPDETLDLGELRTQRGGALLLFVDRSEIGENVRPQLSIGLKESIGSQRFELGSKMPLRFDNLEPGPHRLSAWGVDVAGVSEEFEIEAGKDTEVRIALEPACLVEISVEWPADEKLGFLHMLILREDGEVFSEVTHRNTGALPRPYLRKTRLPVGTFTVKADTGSGLEASTTIHIPDLQAEYETTVLKLW